MVKLTPGPTARAIEANFPAIQAEFELLLEGDAPSDIDLTVGKAFPAMEGRDAGLIANSQAGGWRSFEVCRKGPVTLTLAWFPLFFACELCQMRWLLPLDGGRRCNLPSLPRWFARWFGGRSNEQKLTLST